MKLSSRDDIFFGPGVDHLKSEDVIIYPGMIDAYGTEDIEGRLWLQTRPPNFYGARPYILTKLAAGWVELIPDVWSIVMDYVHDSKLEDMSYRECLRPAAGGYGTGLLSFDRDARGHAIMPVPYMIDIYRRNPEPCIHCGDLVTMHYYQMYCIGCKKYHY